ncbi:MAG TPA: OsmC family protein [Saprospiraceae bacterium]|nr:OsmC family protein [Saprospiraceae bacterium]
MTSEVVYVGELRTEAVHLKSANKIITDAPVDNHGKGEAFSPTDLVATALGSCMLSIMGIAANAHSLDIGGTRVTINKIMAADPRRIIKIEAEIYMPDKAYEPNDKSILEHAALTCPVAKSLHSDIEQQVHFHWQ